MGLSGKKRGIIMQECEELTARINILKMFPVGYISGLREEGFVASYEKIVSMEDESRGFLIGLESADKFKVIVEDDHLARDIGKIAVFPYKRYIGNLEEQFEIICRKFLGLSENAQDFLARLGSVPKFQVIMEDEQLVESMGKLMEFTLEYISGLGEEHFAQQTYGRIIELGEGSRAFLKGLRSARKFQVIMEDERLVESIGKLMEFTLEYISGLGDESFAQTCGRIIIELREESKTFLKGLRSARKFQAIVEDDHLVKNIGKLMEFTLEYISGLGE
jgi:hypothetical protein